MTEHNYIKRDNLLNKLISFKDMDIIKVITGIRYCGKATLLTRIYKDYLLANNVNEDQIIIVDLDSPEYMSLLNYEALYKYIKSLIVKDKRNYIIIEEVQNCSNFQKAVRSLLVENYDVYLTCSNVQFINGCLATLLPGRYVEIKVYPLSFKEYVSASKSKSSLNQKFEDYIRYGSLPYVQELTNNRENIHTYLEGLYHTIFIKDIIARNKVLDMHMLEEVLLLILKNIGNILSANKISDILASNFKSISRHTVNSYLNYLIDSNLIAKVDRYDIKQKQHLSSLSKYYILDTGILNYLLGYKDINKDSLLENIIYLELLRRGYKVYTGKVDEKEVDFIAQKPSELFYVQVKDTLYGNDGWKSNLKKELAPFKTIKDYNQRILITREYDPNTSYDGIEHINAIDFLLA